MQKKIISNVVAKLLKGSIQREADSACVIVGYQPCMPKGAKKYSSRKKK